MFKDRVRETRKEMGLTQEQLGKLLGVSRSTIKDVERGANKGGNLKVIVKLCEVTGKPSTYFLEGDENIELKPFEALEKVLIDVANSPFVDNEGNITMAGLEKDVFDLVRLTLKKLKK
ncbi:MAG: helix-turn-helix transcriptional regulator [Bacilli bacterium]